MNKLVGRGKTFTACTKRQRWGPWLKSGLLTSKDSQGAEGKGGSLDSQEDPVLLCVILGADQKAGSGDGPPQRKQG